MDKSQARSLALSGQLDLIFAAQKEEQKKAELERKRIAALPTLEFCFIIMSEDPEDDSEDNCQKYSQTGYGKTKELAKEDALERFRKNNYNRDGSPLPIFWVKDYDRPF